MQNAQRSAMASSMGRMQGEMQRQTQRASGDRPRATRNFGQDRRTSTIPALTERDAALKNKLDQLPEKAIAELGKLTELFPDREGPDDPNLLTNLDDATMNSLLKNLIAKLSPTKIFPAMAKATVRRAKSSRKSARRYRSVAPSAPKKASTTSNPSSKRCSTSRRKHSTMLRSATCAI